MLISPTLSLWSKRLTNRHGEGVLTGKSLLFGGSPLRPEATGYGLVYIAKIALERQLSLSLKDSRCAVSGSGNVAQYGMSFFVCLRVINRFKS